VTKKSGALTPSAGGQVVLATASAFQGPLPPPEVLAKYNEIDAGLVNRIVTMAEEQAKHRREIENFVTDKSLALSRMGQVFGLTIAMTGLGAAVITTLYNHGVVGALIGTVDLVALVSVFVLGKTMNAQTSPGKPT
jgi:uncharacterized membrane protein